MHLTLRTSLLAAAAQLACGGDSGSTDTDAAATTTDKTTTDPTTAPGTTSTAASTDTPTTGPDPTTATTVTSTTTADTTTGAALDCADLPLCEDFESYADGAPPDPAIWTVGAPNCMGTGKLAVAGDHYPPCAFGG